MRIVERYIRAGSPDQVTGQCRQRTFSRAYIGRLRPRAVERSSKTDTNGKQQSVIPSTFTPTQDEYVVRDAVPRMSLASMSRSDTGSHPFTHAEGLTWRLQVDALL